MIITNFKFVYTNDKDAKEDESGDNSVERSITNGNLRKKER